MKICIQCECFRLRAPEDDWSEVTPGESAVIECTRKHWEMSNGEGRDTFRLNILKAEKCPDFDRAKDIPHELQAVPVLSVHTRELMAWFANGPRDGSVASTEEYGLLIHLFKGGTIQSDNPEWRHLKSLEAKGLLLNIPNAPPESEPQIVVGPWSMA